MKWQSSIAANMPTISRSSISVAIAAIFRPRVYNNTAAIDKAGSLPGVAKAAGALSLILWLSILTMGRLIGYYEGPGSPGKPAAQTTHQAEIRTVATNRATR